MKTEIEVSAGFQNPDDGFDYTSPACFSLIERTLAAGERYLPALPGGAEQEVFVCLTDDSGIRRINADYRDIDKATDVLSFPLLDHRDGFGEVDPIDLDPDTGRLLLGDILLSAEHVSAQAKEYGHSTERELAFLVCHGFLHLRGYDHMEKEEEAVMMAAAEAILKEVL